MTKFKKNSVISHFKQEIIGVLWGTLLLFLCLALFSYNPHDPSFFYYTSEDSSVTNICGFLGAQCAALLFYLFGAASLGFIGIIFFFLFITLMRRTYAREWDRMSAAFILVLVMASFFNVYEVDFLGSRYPGGLLGYAAVSLLYAWLPDMGVHLFLYILLCICLIIVTRLSHVGLVHRALSNLKTHLGKNNATVALTEKIKSKMSGIIFAYSKIRAWCAVHIQSFSPDSCNDYEYASFDHEMLAADFSWHPSSSASMDIGEMPKENVQSGAEQEAPEVDENLLHLQASYKVPDLTMFTVVRDESHDAKLSEELKQCAKILEEKLERFGISGSVVSIKKGPVVTLFEYQPAIDAKISKIIALEDDLALALRALSIRIIAPMPGRSVVGFEIANKNRKTVPFAAVVHSSKYTTSSFHLPLILGEDSIGNSVVVDLASMPHLLVAGSTGSGKSVALNVMLMSLLSKRTPDELKLILIDPKRLEFAAYADIAHLLFPIITESKKVVPILSWVVGEMERRYKVLAEKGARNIVEYNNGCANQERLPYMVVMIDELADVMMTTGRPFEDVLARIAQMARAAGIHMIIATQRPSVDVITGLIKVNFPSRISCKVTSKIDSRTILDCTGAEKLLGRGDMLFLDVHDAQLKRIHGAYVSNKEIAELVTYIRKQAPPCYYELPVESFSADLLFDADDALYKDVLNFINGIEEVSISLLQRKFRIGYNRSARIIDILEAQGLIMPSESGKTRKVIK